MKFSNKIILIFAAVLSSIFLILEIEAQNTPLIIEVPPSGSEDFPTNI